MEASQNIDLQAHNRDTDAETSFHEATHLPDVTVNKVISPRRRRTCSSKISNEQLVFEFFGKFEILIEAGNIFELNELIKNIYKTYDKTLLASIYYRNDNPIRHTHLITLACKHKQAQVLHFLMHQSDILYYLPNSGTIVHNAYKQALRETMNSHNIKVLEMLYDYLSGVGHWPGLNWYPDTDKNITNLKTLNRMLRESQKRCIKRLEGDQQMLVDVNCLISFNKFQIYLYEKLGKSKITIDKSASASDLRRSEVEAIISVILNVFKIYEEFTEKNIRLTKDFEQDKDVLEPQMQSDISIYMKYLSHIMHEIYYRKMDFNIALLVLNNLHLLKQRLNLPEGAYQEIECTLYYFLYRVNDDWQVYLPRDRPKCKKQNPLAICNRDITNSARVLYDPYRLYNGPVIYLEWLKFRESIKTFVNTLECTVIENNLRWEIPKEELNSLTLLPYMRDDYSLKKMVKYIEIIPKIDIRQHKVRNLLIVQRVVQVIGEFLKNSGDTSHLSSTSKALLQAELPKDIIKQIQNLRDVFSHARDGYLIKRIDMENYESQIFEELIIDLEKIGKAIHEVIKLYQPILEKRMIEMGLQLIEERFSDLPVAVNRYKYQISSLQELYALADHDKYMKMENDFLQDKWYKEGFTKQLFREIGALNDNNSYLFTKCHEKVNLTEKNAKTNILKYKNDLQKRLKAMDTDVELWNSVHEDLEDVSVTLSLRNYPNKDCKQKIRDELKKIKCKSSLIKIKGKLDLLADWSEDWIQITSLLLFFLFDAQIFSNNTPEVIRLKNDIDTGLPDKAGIANCARLLDLMVNEAENYCLNNSLPVVVTDDASNDFRAIIKLSSTMKKKCFLTKEESDYLLNNISFICGCTANKLSRCKHCDITKKIQCNELLTVEEYRKIKSLNINEKCTNTVENLVIGFKRDNKFLDCLVKRAKHLEELLEGVRDRQQLVLRYKYDNLFRVAMEIVVCDIMNVFSEGWLKELVNVRFSKMLSEIPLRNVLTHGNPHIEVIGPVLDANDFPRALISFALDFIKDSVYLEEYLSKLYEANVDRSDVFNSSNLSAEQVKLVNNFKQCATWNIYVKLLPRKQGNAFRNITNTMRTGIKN